VFLLFHLKNNDMKANLLITVILPLLFCCGPDNPYPSIGAIPLPAGYHRIPGPVEYRGISGVPGSFADWLRNIPLKKDKTVYLFDGRPKRNQDAQFAVLDVSVGHRDLQQCADAIMRLRSEFLYAQRDFINIDFYSEQGTRLNFLEWANGGRVKLSGNQLINYALSKITHSDQAPPPSQTGGDHYCDDRPCFDEYLQTVFSYCGTRTLERQLVPVRFEDMQIGDVLVHGGSPGHAMLVVDMAADEKGHKIYLLAQSYMPAQDIHIVKNPSDPAKSPWYGPENNGTINTPEYTFYTNQLRRWPRKLQVAGPENYRKYRCIYRET